MGDVCPFCRTSAPESDADMVALVKKRVAAKIPEPLSSSPAHFTVEITVCSQMDGPRAVELWTEAAHLGDLDSHGMLGSMYYSGEYVDRDDDKAIRHWQHAAVKGHPTAR